jgi:hypothetical protein
MDFSFRQGEILTGTGAYTTVREDHFQNFNAAGRKNLCDLSRAPQAGIANFDPRQGSLSLETGVYT